MESHIQHSMESRLDDCIITMTPLRLHYYDYVIAITLLRLRYSVPFRKKVQFCSAISLGAGAHFEFHVIRVGSTDALVVNLVYFMPLTLRCGRYTLFKLIVLSLMPVGPARRLATSYYIILLIILRLPSYHYMRFPRNL